MSFSVTPSTPTANPVTPTTPLSFTVAGDTTAYDLCVIATFPGSNTRELVYSNSRGFNGFYLGAANQVSVSADPVTGLPLYAFTVLRDGGWPAAITISVSQGPAGLGGQPPALSSFSPVDYAAYNPAASAFTYNASSINPTMGVQFKYTKNGGQCSGIRFWVPAAASSARNIKATLWAWSGISVTAVATATASISSSGDHTISFSSPVAMNRYQTYSATIEDITNSSQWYIPPANGESVVHNTSGYPPLAGGNYVLFLELGGVSASGNGSVANTVNGWVAVEPVLT